MVKLSKARLAAVITLLGVASLSVLFQNCAGGELDAPTTEDVDSFSSAAVSTPTPVPGPTPLVASPSPSPSPGSTMGATPTPTPTPLPGTPPALNAGEKLLCRALSSSGYHTVFGLGCSSTGVNEHVYFVGSIDGGAGLHPLYLCHVNPSVDIVSTDVNCEAGRVVGFKLLLGYLADGPTAAMPKSLRRCHHPINGDFLVTYNIAECTNNGYDVEGSLGYGR